MLDGDGGEAIMTVGPGDCTSAGLWYCNCTAGGALMAANGLYWFVLVCIRICFLFTSCNECLSNLSNQILLLTRSSSSTPTVFRMCRYISFSQKLFPDLMFPHQPTS